MNTIGQAIPPDALSPTAAVAAILVVVLLAVIGEFVRQTLR